MIFYFTGTGNTLQLAKQLAEEINEDLVSVVECTKTSTYVFDIKTNEKIGFVFPIYYWGLPTIVNDFINKLQINNYSDSNYTFFLASCGANTGIADKILAKKLKTKQIILNAAFSIPMPDNYIILLDLSTPPDKLQQFFINAQEKLKEIKTHIENKKPHNKKLINRGSLPYLSSTIMYSVYKNSRSTSKFYADDNCINCGKCVDICPLNLISQNDNVIKWKQARCVFCLACIHRCPTHAIQYGKNTKNRNRYVNPNVKLDI